jgi:hypothetical protein
MGTGLEMLIGLAGCTVLLGLGAWFLGRTVARGAPFRPSEPDPWPHGTQEDDDVRWHWSDPP